MILEPLQGYYQFGLAIGEVRLQYQALLQARCSVGISM
jgi:hypothetical protein